MTATKHFGQENVEIEGLKTIVIQVVVECHFEISILPAFKYHGSSRFTNDVLYQ